MNRHQFKYISLCGLASALFFFLLFGCTTERKDVVPYSVRVAEIDSIIRTCKTESSLNALIDTFYRQENTLGRIIAIREQGRRYRNESKFNLAVKSHSKSLALAESIGDSVQCVINYNNIGTDYRRMGILDVASEFHYKALDMCPADSTTLNLKNRVVALNGLGNIFMHIGNYEQADSIFRRALRGETTLGSSVGMAINYANLGSIYQSTGRTDSAWYYYRQSMRLNKIAGSDLGVALCHTSFGNLHESRAEYDNAIAEYLVAYGIMSNSSDEWHALTPCIALARIYLNLGNISEAKHYLVEALDMAESIKSPEHLSQVYRLYYQIYSAEQDSKNALVAYVKSVEYNDSVVNVRKINEIQNLRMSIERTRQQEQLSQMEAHITSERNAKRLGFTIGFAIIVLLVLVILQIVLYLRHRIALARKQAEVQEAKNRFFTNVTHEFRTPLTIIKAAAGELGQDASCNEQTLSRHTQSILRQSDNLLDLVNQLLDVAKMTALDNRQLTWNYANIIDFITDISEGYRDYAVSKGIHLNIVRQVDTVMMNFVPDYIQKIVRNLISNAIKFTPSDGSISVYLSTSEGKLCLSVSDTGVGMSKDVQEHIFEPFYQASSNSGQIGTGLGLSVVKLGVDAMNGTVSLTSADGKGSRFDIAFPINQVVANVSSNVPTVSKPAEDVDVNEKPDMPLANLTDDDVDDETATRILIVEDNHEVAYYMARQLNKYYHIAFADNGIDGYEKAQKIIPDLILTDIMMPGIDGYQLCKQIRANELISHVPVIMVTAKVTTDDRIKGIEVGADGYIEKPFKTDELRLRVEKLLEMRRLLQKKYRGEDVAESVVSTGGETQSADERQMFGQIDNDFLQKVRQHIVDNIDDGEMSASSIASALCLTRHQLNRKVQAITGGTTTDLITEIKISVAKDLLQDVTLPITDVGVRCGFNSMAYFSALFKKMTGVSPSQFRAQNARKNIV